MKKLVLFLSLIIIITSLVRLSKISGKPLVSPTSEYQPRCSPCQICLAWNDVCWEQCTSDYPCSECANCIVLIGWGGYDLVGGYFEIYVGDVLRGTVHVIMGWYHIYEAVYEDCPQCLDCAQDRGYCIKSCCDNWGSGVICPLT